MGAWLLGLEAFRIAMIATAMAMAFRIGTITAPTIHTDIEQALGVAA